MRWLTIMIVFWAISLPLFYVVGLPHLLAKVELKAQSQAYAQCQDQLKKDNMVGNPTSLLKQPRADAYCHCVSEALTLDRSDLIDMVQHKEPEHMTETMKPIVAACNTSLQADIDQTISSGPPPEVTKDPEGVETVHFN